MKNLVHVYDEQLSKDYSYSIFSQQQFLKQLSDNGINITSQTLRNWEKHNLLTPQNRSGQPEKTGLRVAYSEFALAEAFAAYNLINSKLNFEILGNNIPCPKYSLLHVEIARRAFCESEYTVPNFPKPPKNSYTIRYHNPNLDKLFKTLPPLSFNFNNGQWQVKMSPVMNSDELAKHMFFQGLYSAWFSAVQKGCKTFFGSKEKEYYF